MEKACRFCHSPLTTTFVDLGKSPMSNSYLLPEQANRMEPFYPLHAYVCDTCLLVQLEEFESPEAIFSDYAYFSSYSASWLEHARGYCEMAVDRFALGRNSQVVELASNDGYLLKNFAASGIAVLGIEPAKNVAEAAIASGIPTRIQFFGTRTAQQLRQQGVRADLLLGNNVLAHVPDINDFVAGLPLLLADDGVVTMEFPHLLRLIQQVQFDTIYHEHFSYLSLHAVEQVFAHHGLRIFDVETLPTHGGSLRIFACHQLDKRVEEPGLAVVRKMEVEQRLNILDAYLGFAEQVNTVKRGLLRFLIDAKEAGKQVAGYGAPAKGNTLLNYCGVRTDLLDYTVDLSPHKQGKLLPGTHIPVFTPEKLAETKPAYILILPWNLKREIAEQLHWVRDWGAKLVVAVPSVQMVEWS
ncbi:MAG: 2-polyprenyl-3-methyl-5-hydroxy-6-metoxy-1,4-benzoquinol methylase [Gammaproteobacteria bacterium]|jgi:2-polyprenyl-3-methyl-5-hydroxy-6-metoxy-1,4-benzoquinol methylase